ncbi:MAG: transcription antitermination factor NusB [Deltaproteobacteria bacterium RBG_19FT_COMBO_52_11]|jgi:N utilization substance protein B|nr:MAG: transcription antitermination factor NusB [Deltaproteobacteria bacterium RBG_19FT_COMBO_52_11]
MSIRRRAREIALQILYQLDIDRGNSQEVLDLHFENFRFSEKAREFCQRLVEGVCRNQSQIDPLIEENSEHWTLKRMAMVDRNILRLAAFELLHCPDIPFKATLNEAIELAKKYGTGDSSAFINGVLDRIHSLLATSPSDRQTLAN